MVEAEVARVGAARGGRLHVGEGARRGVDGVCDKRVRGYRGAVGDGILERVLEARGEGQELAVGL